MSRAPRRARARWASVGAVSGRSRSARAPRLRACALALALLATAPLAQQPAAAGPRAAAEFALRGRALLDPPGDPDALASPRWEDRAAELDRLARAFGIGAPASGALLQRLLAACDDPHPNVRARALAAWAAAAEDALPAPLAERRAQDLLPLVRLELARALERRFAPPLAPALARLARDADERVRAAGRAALAAHADQAGAAAGALARELAGADDPDALVRWVLALAAEHPDPALARALADEAAAAAQGGGEPERARLALFEALRCAACGAGDAARLARAWPALVRAGHGGARERRALVQRAAQRLAPAACEAFAGAWLDALVALEARVEGAQHMRDAEDPRDAQREELAETCADGALLSVGARRTLALGLARQGLREGWDALLPRLVESLRGWDEASARALLARAGEPALVALETTFFRHGDPVAAALLAERLAGPDDAGRARAFRTLASARGIELEGERLAACWRSLAPERAARALDWLPRDVPFPALREAWLALGEPGGDARRVAVELLAPFAGDAAVRARLERWLEADLAGWEDALATGAAEADARPRELWVQGELRALARVDPERSLPAFARALERAGGRSDDVGKWAVAGLLRSAAGRALLERALAAADDATPGAGLSWSALGERARVEAALGLAANARVLAPEARARLVGVLEEAHPGAAWDLAVRIVDALGTLGGARALAFLEALALDRGRGGEERLAAVEALEGFGGEEGPAALERASRLAPDLETRVAALRALGRALGASDEAERASARARLEQRSHAILYGAEATAEGGELLRESLLFAWSQDAPPGAPVRVPAFVADAWLGPALRRAPADLAQRFAGRDLPAPGFAWTGELALAAALARQGELSGALERAGAWHTLDARLLLALARAAALGAERTRGRGEEGALAREVGGGADAADALARAGLVALAGEPEPDRDAEDARVRARWQLALAARRRGEWGTLARLAGALAAERRAGHGSERVWAECLGAFDREARVDPDARLASLVWQARAWSALRAGAPAAARDAAARAAARLGLSAVAHAEEERLERALAAGAAEAPALPEGSAPR